MKVEEIPSDEIVEMTTIWHKTFSALGCNPMCHCCMKKIDAGVKFHLATVNTYSNDTANSGINVYATIESRDVMLCEDCTVEKMNNRTKSKVKEYEKYRASENGGCFRVNGKIVI